MITQYGFVFKEGFKSSYYTELNTIVISK